MHSPRRSRRGTAHVAYVVFVQIMGIAILLGMSEVGTGLSGLTSLETALEIGHDVRK